MTTNNLLIGTIGTTLSFVGTAIQTNEILQNISLVITIIGGIITFIILPLLNWYHKSKQDGKIDNDEIKDGINIIVDGTKKIKDEIDKKDNNKKEG